MITPFTDAEGSILVQLLIAHCITDFLIQSNKGVRDKEEKLARSGYLWKHVGITMLVAWLILFNAAYWKQVLFIGTTHFLIDLGKIYTAKWGRKPVSSSFQLWLFIIDQLLHVIMIVVAWLWIIGGWARFQTALEGLHQYHFLLRVLGYLLVMGPVSYLIKFLTSKWAGALEKSNDGLQNAGMWIGFLERLLIITLVYMDQFTGIGFLVTAKSILRLIDRPEAPRVDTGQQPTFSSRKHTEYVLIGTFLSFGAAMIIGIVINWLIKH